MRKLLGRKNATTGECWTCFCYFAYIRLTFRKFICLRRFEFYTKIQLSRYREVADSDCTDDDYTLHSVLVHSGNENAGHYVVFIDPHCDGKVI